MPTIKQFSSSISITDFLQFQISSQSDLSSSKVAQVLTLSTGDSPTPKLSIQWGNDGFGGRVRNVLVDGIQVGYLSDNVGITMKSRFNQEYALIDGLTTQPTIPQFLVAIQNSNGLEYLSDGNTATLTNVPTGSGSYAPFDDFFTGSLSGAGSNIYIYKGTTFDFLDLDFAPVIVASANDLQAVQQFFVRASSTVVDPNNIPFNNWDYMATFEDISLTPDVINGVEFTKRFSIIDNMAETLSYKYFTSSYIANFLDSMEIWFYSVDGNDMHVFSQDIPADAYILGQVQYGSRSFTLRENSFTTTNKPLKDMSIRKKNPYYPISLIKQ